MRFALKDMLTKLACLVILGSTLACTSSRKVGDDPKGFLKEYISQSFAVDSLADRDVLIRFLTGPAKTRLAAWSDEQFTQAFIKSKRQYINLVFTEVKTQSPKEVGITYELTYLDGAQGEATKVTQKKFAQLIRTDERWLISEVRNLKELIEYKNEMSLP